MVKFSFSVSELDQNTAQVNPLLSTQETGSQTELLTMGDVIITIVHLLIFAFKETYLKIKTHTHTPNILHPQLFQNLTKI